MNDIGVFGWLGIGMLVIILVAALFLFISFVVDYFGTRYEYKGKQYRLLCTAQCEDRQTREWYTVAIYKNREKQVFVRDLKEFTERFVPVKKNK